MEIEQFATKGRELLEKLSADHKQGVVFLLVIDKNRETEFITLNSEESIEEMENAFENGARPVAFAVIPFECTSFHPIEGTFSIDDRAIVDSMFLRGKGPGYQLDPCL